MQAEEAVEVKDIFARNIDAGPHGIVGALAVRHYDVQAVGCATLKNYNQTLRPAGRFDGAERCSGKETRDGGRAYDSQCAIANKNAPSDRHGEPQFFIARQPQTTVAAAASHLLWNSGDPRIKPAIASALDAFAGLSLLRVAAGFPAAASVETSTSFRIASWVCCETSPASNNGSI